MLSTKVLDIISVWVYTLDINTITTIEAMDLIVQGSKPCQQKNQSYLDMLKETGMTACYKTNLALASGFPLFFSSLIKEVNLSLHSWSWPGSKWIGDKSQTIRVLPLDIWINSPTEPVPKLVGEKLKEARGLNIFDGFSILSPFPFGKEKAKDPILVGYFNEAKLSGSEQITYERDLEFNQARHRYYHIIAWWGHDIDFSKF